LIFLLQNKDQKSSPWRRNFTTHLCAPFGCWWMDCFMGKLLQTSCL